MRQFDHSSSTDEVIAGLSLDGRVAVVTGASSGLGVETARALASAGATVVMVARDEARLDAAAAQLRAAQPQARIETLRMDLADLDSVRSATAQLLAQHPVIHLLVNNAGVMACPLARTAQGFEMQFGTNHLGHFLFTNLLVPALLAGAPARVVNLSSGGHKLGDVNLDDPHYRQRPYEKWQAYGESKTANALFTVGLDARLRDRGVRAFAVHPGVIYTDLARHLDEADIAMISARSTSGGSGRGLKSVAQGAATSVWAATAPELADKGGLYLENCQIAAQSSAPGAAAGVESYAVNPETAERLWHLSEQWVGQTFAAQ